VLSPHVPVPLPLHRRGRLVRYVLTVDGVPVGFAFVPVGNVTTGPFEPFPSFVETGFATLACRLGESLTLAHGPRARPSPRQRRLARAVLQERNEWEPRLGLLDHLWWPIPVARITVVWFALREPFAILDFRLIPLGVVAGSPARPNPAGGARPAAQPPLATAGALYESPPGSGREPRRSGRLTRASRGREPNTSAAEAQVVR
jgi:hypothetical protein